MSLATWTDDRLNPILVKEVRQAVRSRFMLWFLPALLGLLCFILWLMPLDEASNQDVGLGGMLFMVILGLATSVLTVAIPAAVTDRIIKERNQNKVDLIGISTMGAARIVAGRFLAGAAVSAVLMSCCLPFLVFCYFLRGVSITMALTGALTGLMIIWASLMLHIFLSSIPVQKAYVLFSMAGHAACLSLVGTWLAFMGLSLAMGGSILSALSAVNLPLAIGAIVSGLVFVLALLFSLTLVNYSSPTANRVMPTRIVLLLGWLVTGGFVLAISGDLGNSLPSILWIEFVGGYLIYAFAISACERDAYGPRLRAKVPQAFWLRPLAFPFYTGALNGMLFAAVLIMLTMGSGYGFVEAVLGSTTMEAGRSTIRSLDAMGSAAGSPTAGSSTQLDAQIQYSWLSALHMMAVGLIGLWIRRKMGWKKGYTFLVIFILGLLLSGIPRAMAFMQLGFEPPPPGITGVTMLLAPSGALLMESDPDQRIVGLISLGVMLLLGLGLNARWMASCVASFRPPERSAR